MTDLPPWRRPPRDHFPGVPAWSMPASAVPEERFEVSPIGSVTREWAWGDADGSGVRVCVLDSGVDASHPLVGGLDRAMDVVPGEDGPVVVPTEPGDEAGHGTACASVIRSIAPAVSLTSVRVLAGGKHGTGAALLAGLGWAIDEGYDIINMSLSTTKPQFCDALRELSDRAYFRRCVIVASAHNMPVRSYPWPFAAVISVASHDGPDPMTYYYNPSPPVEFYARGVRVRVAWSGGREILSTGNSFATPHIAGISALILSKHRSLTPFQLKSVLYSAAENVAEPTGGAHVD
ncbi:S8 family serine peptidase [Actinoallomurus sp. NPDC052274]|uniref:S8 family serine peptidase n=1 Tax=Actinoallomurus sp. NPDC052274 TaxID=3155420 RepID=UPI00343D3C7F